MSSKDDRYGIGSIIEANDIRIFDACSIDYTEFHPNRERGINNGDDETKRIYLEDLIRLFEKNEQVYVTDGVHRELIKKFERYKRIYASRFRGISKPQIYAYISELETFLQILKRRGRILRLPSEEAEIMEGKKEIEDRFSKLTAICGLSKTDFDLLVSSIICGTFIGNTALLTDDDDLMWSTSFAYSEFINSRRTAEGVGRGYSLRIFTRYGNYDVFKEAVVSTNLSRYLR